MARKNSAYVWVRLQLDREMIDFAETQWRQGSYFSRNDYINGVLNMAMLHAMVTPPLELPIFDPDDHPKPDRLISVEELRRTEDDGSTGPGSSLDDELPF